MYNRVNFFSGHEVPIFAAASQGARGRPQLARALLAAAEVPARAPAEQAVEQEVMMAVGVALGASNDVRR